MLKNVNKLNRFIRERNKFSNDTFGSPEVRSCIYPLKHLQEEVQELIDNPNDTMEWADCFLLLLDAAWRKGYTIDDLVEFSSQKLKINKKRKWDKKADGTYKHVKEEFIDPVIQDRYLYDADPKCKHIIISEWSGVRCKKCKGWFCY